MRSLKLSLLSLSLVAGISSTAAAQQVNFDDLPGLLTMIDSPYAGLNWDHAFVMQPASYLPTAGGFATVLSSGDRVMGNAGAGLLTISGSTFNLLSGKFAAGWTNGLNLNVQGFAGSTLVYDQNYTLNWSEASFLNLNLLGVDRVTFASSGGSVDDAFHPQSNQSFAADNLEFEMNADGDVGGVAVVPEPMTVSLMAAGLLALGGVQARRRRRTS